MRYAVKYTAVASLVAGAMAARHRGHAHLHAKKGSPVEAREEPNNVVTVYAAQATETIYELAGEVVDLDAAKAGIDNIGQLLEALKQNPDKYNFPSPGAGTVSHLAVELLLQRIGARATHVPYPSSPAALTSLLSGDTQFAALPPIAVMPMVKDGRLKALAVTSSKRSTLLPEIPTLAEVGVPGIEGSAWIGFVISSKVPADIQKKLSDALIQAIRDPEVVKRLQAQFMDPVGSTPAEFRAYMDDELKRWEPLITKLGIKGQ